jgi:adenylate cyclase
VNERPIDELLADQFVIPGEPRYSRRDLARLTGVSVEDHRRIWRALGFPDVDDDEQFFTDYDLEVLNTAAQLIDLQHTNVDEAIQMARVIGSSMARVAEASVQGDPLEGAEDSAEIVKNTADVVIPSMAKVLEYAWRRHLQAAIRRAVARRDRESTTGHLEMAVGFADLVGFPALSQQLSERALAEVVSRFEALAYDTVTDSGGRVVKMIGDEVMFVAADPGSSAAVGLALSDAYSDDEMLSDVRVGLAMGAVLLKDGDVYGRTVNLANRIVKIAAPGSVVTSEEIHDALADDPRFDWRSLRPRFLKGLGRVPLYVLRRADLPEPTEPNASPRERARLRRQHVKEAVRDKVERSIDKLTPGRGDDE